MVALLIGYARVSTDQQDMTAPDFPAIEQSDRRVHP
jgi:DNA invertase Pin-like site-specific DNA recombinase